MPAAAVPTTFLDLATDVLNRVRGNTSGTTELNLAKRYLNMGNHDLHIQRNWPWAERRAFLNTHDTYTTGSVSIASTARTTLEGANTLWTTAVSGMGFNNVRVGGKIHFNDGEVYLISAVSSATAATLDSRYVGGQTTATAYALAYGGYTYFEDEYALASDFWRLVDARSFSDALDIEVLSRQDFYRNFPRNTATGTPRYCTIIELGPSGSVALRPRILFRPAPDAVVQIPYRYITSNLAVDSAGAGAANMSGDTDEPIVPLKYRHVLVFYSCAAYYRDRKDDQRAGEHDAAYVDLVKRMANDTIPEQDVPRLMPSRGRYLAGVAGRYFRGSRRFSADRRFDELRD